MTVLEELEARGLVHEATDRAALGALLAKPGCVFYIGFDPSGASLHVGTLIPITLMIRLARAGHKPIAVIGGATGMIGDPSGKSAERKLLDDAALEKNVASVSAQLAKFLPGVEVANNADWTQQKYLEFLRDVGKHITVNYMLAKESVRARLEDREHGISYTEFSYMLLQAWDYAVLARDRGCRLQCGGSDQWGNITCGIELARKLGVSGELHGLVTPLLMNSSGTKFGKTEGGTSVWLDAAATSPYAFYQFWFNAEDADVERYLKLFTFLSLDEIADVVKAHDVDRAKRIAQKKLAEEVTRLAHGDAGVKGALAATQVLFGGSLEAMTDDDLLAACADAPSSTIAKSELAAGVGIIDLLVRTGLAKSKTAARQTLEQGGIYVNNVKVDDMNRKLGDADRATASFILLRSGKKNYHLLRVTTT
jgi:tyrosyl-tRNA synthetase